MKYLLTNAQMREADKFTIENLGVPSLELMERAGDALYQEAKKLAPKGRVLCVCGGGNNGGDGFVCGRKLLLDGRRVDAVFFAEKTSEECEINKSEFEMNGGTLFSEFPERKYSLVVDCLFGTGYRPSDDERVRTAIERINLLKRRGVKVLSADIPSGLSGDNGVCLDVAVQADETVCIGEIKLGAVLNDGIDCAGKLIRADIGIALPSFDENGNGYAYLLQDETVSSLLPKRKRNVHKGNCGRAYIVGGSYAYSGAGYLAAAGALKSGAGYVTLCVPEDLIPVYMLKLPEVLLKPVCKGKSFAFDERAFEFAKDGAVAYGMGLGVSQDVANGAEYLVTHYTGRLIIDADGLNSLSAYAGERLKELFAEKSCDVVLTPHPREFARLLGTDVADVLQNGVSLAKTFAKEHGVTVLLKGATTVITDGVRVAVNAEGNAGQAKGGSGDVLSGVIAGLCASGLSAFDGAVCGAFLAGRSANLAKREIGEYALTPSDVVAYMGRAFLTLETE